MIQIKRRYTGAVLHTVDSDTLRWADLSGAYLSDTCLDPMHAANADVTGYEIQTTRNGETWCVGYRTGRSVCVGSTAYEPGTIHEAPVFSVADTDCYPGLYVFPTPEAVREWGKRNNINYPEIVRVWFRAVDCHRAGDKWRVRWFVVAGKEG